MPSASSLAAWRAVESLETDPLVSDLYAVALSGQRAFRAALSAARPFAPAAPEGLQAHADRRRRVSNVAARVWWFDDRSLRALRRPGAPKQVVVLGAGMDTRPWRCELPPGVRWFEVDRGDVLRSKARALELMGAQTDARAPSTAATMPLRAATWAAVEADLCDPSWADALARAGYDAREDTLWILEGILMYLTEAQALRLLADARAACGPNSAAVMHDITDALIADWRAKTLTHYPPFTKELVDTWEFGLPIDPTRLLAQTGWVVREAITRAGIAHEIFKANADVDLEGTAEFETRIGFGMDAYSVFVAAGAN